MSMSFGFFIIVVISSLVNVLLLFSFNSAFTKIRPKYRYKMATKFDHQSTMDVDKGFVVYDVTLYIAYTSLSRIF